MHFPINFQGSSELVNYFVISLPSPAEVYWLNVVTIISLRADERHS
jgi:hypothetical protein